MYSLPAWTSARRSPSLRRLSALTKENFNPDYWGKLHRWYGGGGIAHVAAYLDSRNLSGFDAKAPPPQTEAFHEIVAAGRTAEDGELVDALVELNWPSAVILSQIILGADAGFAIWLQDRKNARLVPDRMEACGYVAVPNPRDKWDGRWNVGVKRQMIYASASLSVRDRFNAIKQRFGLS